MDRSKNSKMGIKLPLWGGCQCANIRYQVNSAPKMFYFCHCKECQRQASSAHGQSMWVEKSNFELTGKLCCFERATDSGNTMQCYFCPDCGVRIYHRSVTSNGILSLKAGTLDEAKSLRPAGHIWTRSKQAHFGFKEGELIYDREPVDNFKALYQRWQEIIDITN